MLTLGQLVEAIHSLHRKVGLAKHKMKLAENPAEAFKIATETLEEVDKELERIED